MYLRHILLALYLSVLSLFFFAFFPNSTCSSLVYEKMIGFYVINLVSFNLAIITYAPKCASK